jgi:peptide subunit release factor 1 (eRF1)
MVELVAAGLKIGPNDRETDERFSSRRFLVDTMKDDSNTSKVDKQRNPSFPPSTSLYSLAKLVYRKTLKECQGLSLEEVKAQ